MTLSRSARNVMQQISRGCPDGRVRFHREEGRYYLPNGNTLRSSAGLRELIDEGVFLRAGDGLFPGFDQTFVFNTDVAARHDRGS